MQTPFVKYAACLLLSVTAYTSNAQTKTQATGYSTSTKDGKSHEEIATYIDGTAYKMETLNEKITALYVDGKLVPADQYGQYGTIISKIKEQLRLDKIQAKKDQEKAGKDQALAKTDMERAKKDQYQAKLDQERSMKDQVDAKIQAEKAGKDMHQAKLQQEHAMAEQAEAKLQAEKSQQDQQQAKMDAEQAKKDQEQAKLDQEQAMKDQAKSKLDQQQAEEDQKLLKNLLNDLVKEGIAADEKSIVSVVMSPAGLFVNDKKQSDELYTKYKDKYSRFANGNFSYSNSPNGNKTMRMHRP